MSALTNDELDRLLELARRAASGSDWYKRPVGSLVDAEFIAACTPDTIIRLIERVEEAELEKAEARLRAAEEVVEVAMELEATPFREVQSLWPKLRDALCAYDEAVKND